MSASLMNKLFKFHSLQCDILAVLYWEVRLSIKPELDRSVNLYTFGLNPVKTRA